MIIVLTLRHGTRGPLNTAPELPVCDSCLGMRASRCNHRDNTPPLQRPCLTLRHYRVLVQQVYKKCQTPESPECHAVKLDFDINDQKLLTKLLASTKKATMRKWLKIEPPTIDEWIEIVHEIYVMEKISFYLKVGKEKAYRIWTKWIECVKPVMSDFHWLCL